MPRPVQIIIVLSALLALGTSTSCVENVVETATDSPSTNTATIEQPVVVTPVFEVHGLDTLPQGLHLQNLYLGVGAIFLDRVNDDDGVAFANLNPLQLHFDLADGQLRATAPAMILPEGGNYQVSVQIEPLVFTHSEAVDALDEGDEASMGVDLTVEDEYIPGDLDGDEPAPLPWMPTGSLRGDIESMPFSFTSRRSVRFTLEQVELVSGDEIELVLRLSVGRWIEETVRPVLDITLGEITEEQLEDVSNGKQVDLTDDLEGGPVYDGLDDLIGDIDIEVHSR